MLLVLQIGYHNLLFVRNTASRILDMNISIFIDLLTDFDNSCQQVNEYWYITYVILSINNKILIWILNTTTIINLRDEASHLTSIDYLFNEEITFDEIAGKFPRQGRSETMYRDWCMAILRLLYDCCVCSMLWRWTVVKRIMCSYW